MECARRGGQEGALSEEEAAAAEEVVAVWSEESAGSGVLAGRMRGRSVHRARETTSSFMVADCDCRSRWCCTRTLPALRRAPSR